MRIGEKGEEIREKGEKRRYEKKEEEKEKRRELLLHKKLLQTKPSLDSSKRQRMDKTRDLIKIAILVNYDVLC